MKIFESPESKLAKAVEISKEDSKDFEQEISKLTEATSFTIQEYTPNAFSEIVKDPNEMHTNEKVAQEFSKKFGLSLKAPPAHGTLFHALQNVYCSEILDLIELATGKKYVYDAEKFIFKNFAYRGDELKFHIRSVDPLKGNKKGVDITLQGLNQDKQLVMDVTKLQLRSRYERLGEIRICEFLKKGVFFDYEIEINQDIVKKYNDCIESPNQYKFRNSLVASVIPASLLQLCQIKTEKMEGLNRNMDISYYRQPKIGSIETYFKNRTEPKSKDNKWAYNFEALCIQNNAAILGAKFKVTTTSGLT